MPPALQSPVLFEAGYFHPLQCKDRVLVVREEGTKMPSDLGGDIYGALLDRRHIGPILDCLRRLVTGEQAQAPDLRGMRSPHPPG